MFSIGIISYGSGTASVSLEYNAGGASCAALVTPTTYYYTITVTNGGTFPLIGDIIYTDIGKTIVLNGGSNWYKYGGGSFQINASGVIIDNFAC